MRRKEGVEMVILFKFRTFTGKILFIASKSKVKGHLEKASFDSTRKGTFKSSRPALSSRTEVSHRRTITFSSSRRRNGKQMALICTYFIQPNPICYQFKMSSILKIGMSLFYHSFLDTKSLNAHVDFILRAHSVWTLHCSPAMCDLHTLGQWSDCLEMLRVPSIRCGGTE